MVLLDILVLFLCCFLIPTFHTDAIDVSSYYTFTKTWDFIEMQKDFAARVDLERQSCVCSLSTKLVRRPELHFPYTKLEGTAFPPKPSMSAEYSASISLSASKKGGSFLYWIWERHNLSIAFDLVEKEVCVSLTGSMALSFKAGDLVSVEKKNFHLSDRETGIVLRTGCSYEEEGGVFEDGIMVKMQISNTRGIFPPSLVSSFISSPAASKRRALSRRARVTPSPTIGVGMSTDEQAKESSTKQEEASGKRARKADPEGEDVSLKKSKFFDSSSASADQDTDDASSSAMELRVQRAPSAKTKCQECKTGIRKNALRLQPTSLKRGWLHAHCILIRFGSSSMPSPDQIGGYDDLSSAEQQELLAGLSGMPVDGTKKIIASKSESSSNEEDTPLATLRKPVAAGAKRKKQSSPTRRENINANGNDNNMIVASDSDCDDDKDMPFRVEYATSGRATCKGCDERIQNKTLRIVNRPLFRGKPGFSVYRHLHCTVFEEEIVELKDVGGWRKLDQKDRELLEDRIEESKSLIQKENEELKPDELVHTTFQGEIRGPPPGLSANLLPFQVEGVSWMRHQEVEVPEIRGGIMADEMGMVS